LFVDAKITIKNLQIKKELVPISVNLTS